LKALGVDGDHWKVDEYRKQQLEMAAKLVYKNYDALAVSMRKVVENLG
jgi:hypothetical protein